MGQLAILYIGITLYRYATEEREKRFIKDTFGRYLAPTVVEELTKDPRRLELGGETKELTAFFSDIASFSSFSEKLSPQDLVSLLNEYLTEMADIIVKHEGTVDKYEGDAVMAFYGAPIHFDDHAVRACLACLEMQDKIKELRERWQKDARWLDIAPNLRVRMGLNTGEMLVGNMGSKNRMNYTIMGDAVNLASRLEGANKQYGTLTMLSEFTHDAARDAIEVRELDRIRVVGRKKPVVVYELLSKKGELDPKKKETIEVYLEGLMAYKERRYEEGLRWFKKALEIDPNDSPSKTYISRCEGFKIKPPPPDWDGVYEMLTK